MILVLTRRKPRYVQTHTHTHTQTRTSCVLIHKHAFHHQAAETKTEHVADKIRKYTKHLQKRIYAVAVQISSGDEEKKTLWSKERKNFVRLAIVEGCEKLLMTKLHDTVFGHLDSEPPNSISECTTILEECFEKDERFSSQAIEHSFVTCEHLDIPEEDAWEMNLFRSARLELQSMCLHRCPRNKMTRIMNCCRLVSDVLRDRLSHSDTPAGADDFFPLLVMVVLHARPCNFDSELRYVELYRDPSMMRGEADYFFQSMCGAAEFVRNKLVCENLTITSEMYDRSRGVVMMNDRFRLSTISKILLVPCCFGTKREGNSVLAEWIRERFRFRNKIVSELSVSDLPALKYEHSCLLQTYRNFQYYERHRRRHHTPQYRHNRDK